MGYTEELLALDQKYEDLEELLYYRFMLNHGRDLDFMPRQQVMTADGAHMSSVKKAVRESERLIGGAVARGDGTCAKEIDDIGHDTDRGLEELTKIHFEQVRTLLPPSLIEVYEKECVSALPQITDAYFRELAQLQAKYGLTPPVAPPKELTAVARPVQTAASKGITQTPVRVTRG